MIINKTLNLLLQLSTLGVGRFGLFAVMLVHATFVAVVVTFVVLVLVILTKPHIQHPIQQLGIQGAH
jgi:hypothetical protein